MTDNTREPENFDELKEELIGEDTSLLEFAEGDVMFGQKDTGVERRLTEEEARQFVDLFQKVQGEMTERLHEGDYNKGSITYTDLIRDKYVRYVRNEYLQ